MTQARGDALRRKLVRGILASTVAWLCVALAFTAWRSWSARVQARPFEREQWRSQSARRIDEHGRTLRQEMSDDLLDRHLRAGMTVAEVLALVGPPDIQPSDEGRQAMDDWVWRMGAERGPFVDGSEWLSVAWDAHGRVARAWLWNG